MKKIPCSYSKCSDHRVHHEKPETPRGVQIVEVDDDYDGPAYCSITCATLDGAMNVRKPLFDRLKTSLEESIDALKEPQ